MKTNAKAVNNRRTEGGARASAITPEQELRRQVMALMLWENGGQTEKNVASLIPKCRPEFVAACAFEARTKMKLRHVPLFIAREMARHPEHKSLVGKLLPDLINRADEINEFMAIYWKNGKTPISAQVKKGLAAAFKKFGPYALAKYNKTDMAIKMRDVMFLTHAKPADAPGDKYTKEVRKAERAGQKARQLTKGEKLFSDLINDKLETPDTWETNLSAGADKKETFERLMSENKLGALAFIRNLRNMVQAGVSRQAMKEYGAKVNLEYVLPFRFLSAARQVPGMEDLLEPMMLRCLEGQPKLPGKTVLILDTSGSMHAGISGKSDLTRLDTAAALAILVREICEDVVIYCTAGSDGARRHATMQIPARRGFALADYIRSNEVQGKIGGGGIFLKQCLDFVEMNEKTADRVITLTDEIDCDDKASPEGASTFGENNYIINVATQANGIAYSKFTHINGWSEAVIDFIRVLEEDQAAELQ